MNALGLAWAYLRARPLTTALNLVLFSLGIATMTVLLLFSAAMENRIGRDLRGIDLVVGAKGSPLQLILSSVFHADIPTGNIPLAEAEQLARNRLVRQAIPLAMGDNVMGFRIIGAPASYAGHYGATLAAGRLWAAPFEATLGADVAKKLHANIGDKFVGNHGLAAGGEAHEMFPYTVVGILNPTGSAIDRLVLTPIESVWRVHEHHDADDPPEIPGARHEREVTAVLIRYATPLAAAWLPRQINGSTGMQAASPAFEAGRLMTLVGVGAATLRGFAWALLGSAALGVFVALYNALNERRYDLAVMRCLGATRARLVGQLLTESLAMAAAGCALGLLAGHLAAELAGRLLPQAAQLGLTGLVWRGEEFYLVGIAALAGLAAGLLPAWRASRVDVAILLAQGK